MSIQLDLFADEKPAEKCKTCGAVRPADYPRRLFLEPVSSECDNCNRATIDEIFRATMARDQPAIDAAWTRHGSPPRRRRP